MKHPPLPLSLIITLTQSLNLTISTPLLNSVQITQKHTHTELMPIASSLTSYVIKSSPPRLPLYLLPSLPTSILPDSSLSSFHFSFRVQINAAFIQAGMP